MTHESYRLPQWLEQLFIGVSTSLRKKDLDKEAWVAYDTGRLAAGCLLGFIKCNAVWSMIMIIYKINVKPTT
jgi:hypothetical protein